MIPVGKVGARSRSVITPSLQVWGAGCAEALEQRVDVSYICCGNRGQLAALKLGSPERLCGRVAQRAPVHSATLSHLLTALSTKSWGPFLHPLGVGCPPDLL